MVVKHRVTPKNCLSHWNVNILLPINSEEARRSPHKSVSLTLQFPADHVAVPPAARALSHRMAFKVFKHTIHRGQESKWTARTGETPLTAWGIALRHLVGPFPWVMIPSSQSVKGNTCLVGTGVTVRIQHLQTTGRCAINPRWPSF